MFTALVVMTAITNGGVTAQTATTPSIPEPVPGTDRVYDDTYRLLASDDPDPLYNTTTIQVPEYQPSGSVIVFNKTVGTNPVRLETDSLHPTDALKTAYSTDVYTTSLTDNAATIPYQDTWKPLTEVRSDGLAVRTRIYPLQNISFGKPTSTDGEYRVEILTPNGEWFPVYDADVQPDTSVDGYTVANPGSALVHIPESNYIAWRRLEALRSLLQYSELAPSESDARSTAVIPTRNGTELYPTQSGGATTRYWRTGPVDVFQDVYVGVSDMPPGVWYDSRYVTRTPWTTAHVPWDYRIEAPSNYWFRSHCRHNHTTGNTTRIEYHPKRNWARYTILDSDATVDATITNGTYAQPMYRLGGPGGIWSTYDDANAINNPLTPGDYTIVAELTIEAELEKRYGVTSAECREWDRVDTDTKTLTVTRSVPVTVIDETAGGLTIDATLYDKPGNDVLALEWTGNQNLTADPWQDVTVSIGNKTAYIVSPWRFYSVSQNSAVEERTATGTTTVDAGHSQTDRYPRLLRNRVSVANVTTRLVEESRARSWWRDDHEVIADTVPGTSLPTTIIAPDNDAPTHLYHEYAGIILSTDDATGEPVSIEARTPFDRPITASINVVPYEEATLDVWLTNSTAGTEFVVRLTDTDTGAPLAGRTISLRGTASTTVTTNSSGMATATPTGTNIMATFDGDYWRTPRTTYYLGDTEGIVTGFGVVAAIASLTAFINMGVSNVVLVIEWVALGIFAYWWVRTQGRQAGRGA